jgi:hypothetical protein
MMTTSSASRPRHIAPIEHETTVADERRAARYFWTVLILATSASVAGNVTHAVLSAPTSTVVVAAAAALVPPTVLLGATHSVALLVRTRANSGFTYWCALLMTLGLALSAFVLSFDALRSLAITAGIDRRFAWLWPLVIDVTIAQATMALLSLTLKRRTTPPPHAQSADARNGHQPSRAPLLELEEPAAESRWSEVARALVRERRTKIEPTVVAKVLAMTEAQTPPSTIGRRLNVHHSAVRRIQEAAAELTG